MELNLKFDKKSPDSMEAAKRFLETEKANIEAVKNCVIKGCQASTFGQTPSRPTDKDLWIENDMSKKVEKFTKLIAENTSLYCELEMLNRGRAKNVVEKELQLLVQNVKYYYGVEDKYILRPDKMYDVKARHTFLPLLLDTCDEFKKGMSVTSSDSTIAICHLFSQHAKQSGFDVQLKYHPTDNSKGMKGECLGVVTEKSDVDSAVDVFLASDTKCHWGVRRLYVQESTYARFKKALTFKCGLNKNTSQEEAPALCSEAQFYDDKVFFFDYAGTEDQIEATNKHVVLVEAYRTVKELLSLIEKASSCYLSLWCSDISEANEIAYMVNTPLVWINGYAHFDGPFCPSKALHYKNSTKYVDKTKYEEFFKVYSCWVKLSVKERKLKLDDCLKTYSCDEKHNDLQKYVKILPEKLEKLLGQVKLESIAIEKGKIWVDMKTCKGLIGMKVPFSEYRLTLVVLSMILGNGVMMYFSPNDSNVYETQLGKFVEWLSKQGMPVTIVDENAFSDIPPANSVKLDDSGLYNLKSICTSFGTIFAN